MPSLLNIIHIRTQKRSASHKDIKPTLGRLVAVFFSLIFASGAIGAAWVYAETTKDLPSIERIPDLLDPPDGLFLQPTRIYDRTGKHVLMTLMNPLVGERVYQHYPGIIAAEQESNNNILPSLVISATVASAQNYSGVPEWLPFSYLVNDELLTLAEKIISETILRNEPSALTHKIRRKILALQLINQYGPEKCIEWYLNHLYFGYKTYGIQAGAKLYFDKPAEDLNFSEAALLTAISEHPDQDLSSNKDLIMNRQKEIIQEALAMRLISPSDGLKAFREIPVITLPSMQDSQSSFYKLEEHLSQAAVSLSLSQLLTQIPADDLWRGGLRVLTTLDFDLQVQIECIRQLQIDRMISNAAPDPAGILSHCLANNSLPALSIEQQLSPGQFSAEVIVLNPANGQISAISAGDSSHSDILAFNYYKVPDHPAGSLATLFIYLTGLSRDISSFILALGHTCTG